MKRLLIVSLLVFLVAACAGPITGFETIAGSGQLASQVFDLSGFSRIDANSGAQIQVTRGEPFRVEVEVDDNLVSHLDVAVRGDTLYVALKNGSYRDTTLRAQITMPELAGAKLNGASTLNSAVDGEDLALNLNGASQTMLTGTTGRVTIQINGASQALLGDLAAGDVSVDVNGGSHVEVRTSGRVSGKANGASTVIVAGSPSSVNVNAQGASTVITP